MPPALVYAVNLSIGVILAGAMSRHWRLEAGGGAFRYWIVAAWTLAAADLLFIVRAMVPNDFVRLLPTLVVTVGQLLLITAAERTTERPISTRAPVVVVAVHAAFLLVFVPRPDLGAWRAVGNAVLWSGLAFTGAWVLSRRVGAQHTLMQIPATVLAAHGVFHLVRLYLAARFAGDPDSALGPTIQMMGDIEVSLFMVALFVSTLLAFLEQRQRDLQAALDSVRELSSMLPICAWCHNVRDDDGYWTQIEAYLAAHHVNVTHSICESCSTKHFRATTPVSSAAVPPTTSRE